MLCFVIDNARVMLLDKYLLVRTNDKLPNIIEDAKKLNRINRITYDIKAIDIGQKIAVINKDSSSVTFSKVSEVKFHQKIKNNFWNVLIISNLSNFDLNESYLIEKLVFEETEIKTLLDPDCHDGYDKIFSKSINTIPSKKLKSSTQRKIHGTIHGHGKMRRENLEASYMRTEEYLEKLRREGKDRKKR